MVDAVPRQPAAVLVVSAWHEGTPPKLAARVKGISANMRGPDGTQDDVICWLRLNARVREGNLRNIRATEFSAATLELASLNQPHVPPYGSYTHSWFR